MPPRIALTDVHRRIGTWGGTPAVLAAAVLAISGTVTYSFWRGARRDAENDLRAEFAFRVHDTEARIGERMHVYVQVLRGVAGLLLLIGGGRRRTWRADNGLEPPDPRRGVRARAGRVPRVRRCVVRDVVGGNRQECAVRPRRGFTETTSGRILPLSSGSDPGDLLHQASFAPRPC